MLSDGLYLSDLRVGDYVRYHPEVETSWTSLEDSYIWEGEPLDCMLEVVGYKGYGHERAVLLECTMDCGGHNPGLLSLTRHSYDFLSQQLGCGLLVGADTWHPQGAEHPQEKQEILPFTEDLSFEAMVAEIEQMILSGNLPTQGQSSFAASSGEQSGRTKAG